MSASNKKRGAPEPERGTSTRNTKRQSYGPSAIVSRYYSTESIDWAYNPPRSAESLETGSISPPLTDPPESLPVLPVLQDVKMSNTLPLVEVHPPPRSAESQEAGPITSPLTEPPESSPILPTQDSEMTQSTLPETEWELKMRFAAHLQERLSTTFTPTIKEAESLRKANRPLWSLRALAMDPESIIEGLNLQKMREWTADGLDLQSFFDADVMGPLVGSLHLLRQGWYNENAEATKRSSEDIKAQTEVKEWYNNTCVLCGGQLVTQGAHIIDVAAQKQTKPLDVWRTLRMFWPLEKLAALDIKEDRNILPLSPTAHALWDLHEFGLRPVKHSTDPDHILFLQVVVFKKLHVEIGFSSNRPKGGFSIELADIREDPPKLIRHGDVYKLVTTDPEQRPLPRFHYLQLRYAVQTILAAQKAAGAIRTLFGGPPPDSTMGPELEDVRVPSQWQQDLDEAKRLGVLDFTSQSKWERAILESEYRKAYAWSEDEDIESESTDEENVQPRNSSMRQVKGE